ncbi:MFS transporter [Bradyrhizobium glycinis]|uniref:MFS transporter n=1 Tax=Bradyrhizobium glycinis TaxID=2751812 RepID=UPI0018D5FDBE|nr:MFS transporter [Bradyrhizobium glycinis]MBH5370962.1 MFS transporter [Bradyrhizobium glycinis]
MRTEPREAAIIRNSDKLVVAALGGAEIINYGTLYYCVAVVAGHVAADFAISDAAIFASFSFALFASGLMSFPAGSLMDRYGAGITMKIASVAAALSLGLAAISWNIIVFMLALFGMQIASAFLFYEAAFVLLVQRNALRARRHIILLTLIVGFSSTLFWPLTSLLLNVLSWREVLALYAGCNIFVALPLIGFAHDLRSPSADNENNSENLQVGSQRSPRAVDLVLVTTGFSLTTFVFSALLGQMIPILSAIGLGQGGAMISALFGPSQVLIRLFASSLSERMGAIHLTILSSVLLSVATAVVAMASDSIMGASVFVVLLGFSSGLNSICRGALPLSIFGQNGYGRRIGLINGFRLSMASFAPYFFSFTQTHHGTIVALTALVACGFLSVLAFVLVTIRPAGPASRDTNNQRNSE